MCAGKKTKRTSSMMDICFPNWDDLDEKEKENWDIVLENLAKNPVWSQFLNLQTAWKAITLSMLSALVLSMIYIYFLSIFAEYVAWGIIILTEVAFIALTFLGIYIYAAHAQRG